MDTGSRGAARVVAPRNMEHVESTAVPKMKTHKGAAKRFHVTGTGKVMTMAHHRNNKRMVKRQEKLYSLRGKVELDSTHLKRVKRLLPYAF